MLHLAVDVGGTFTEICLFDDQEGAKRDYGVLVREVDAELAEWEVDEEATEEERTSIRNNRIDWLDEDPAELARRYQEGKIGTFELLPTTTEDFRAMLERRVVPHWKNDSQQSRGA
jgi:N-methylhydantoinase B